MQPLTKVTEISRIGYGFMASKVLFAAHDQDEVLISYLMYCVDGGLIPEITKVLTATKPR